jgi:hypothetical protein
MAEAVNEDERFTDAATDKVDLHDTHRPVTPLCSGQARRPRARLLRPRWY